MPKGLITINKLIELLLQEVWSFDAVNYRKIVLRKVEISKAIKKDATLPLISELYDPILPGQISVVLYYAERLPRIQRIIGILKKGKSRVSRKNEKVYGKLLKFLREMAKLGAVLPAILEEEREAINKRGARAYLKLFEREKMICERFSEQLTKIAESVYKEALPGRPMSSWQTTTWEKILLLVLSVLLVFVLGVLSTMAYPQYKESRFLRKNVPAEQVLLQECIGNLGIMAVVNPSGDTQPLEIALRSFWQQDLQRELAVEINFQKLTGIEISGGYAENDISLVTNFLGKTYGYDLKKYGVESIVFLPKGSVLRGESCPSQVYAGTAVRGQIILFNSEISNPNAFLGVLAHELGHLIHIKKQEEYPKFNVEWTKIRWGYPTSYSTTNLNENVAEVFATVIESHLKGQSILAFDPIDHNRAAFMAKVRLLQEHGFFPPQIRIE